MQPNENPKQELGPKQKLVVEALRSKKYTQGKDRLCTITESGAYYCCLGVMNEVLGLGETDGNYLRNTYLDIGLYSGAGLNKDRTTTLSTMNDSGATFFEIANLMENNPETFFSKPV
jgi:hypothetical protein